MLGSIYVGLSGLGAYSEGLQTISNNVANLNTSGFKVTTVGFTELYSEGARSTSAAGGSEQGHGVKIASPRLDFRQGDLRQTTNDLDLAIEGKGFLVLLDEDKTFYTRTGQFSVDDKGYITENDSGYRLGTLDSHGNVVSRTLESLRTNPPEATKKVIFSDNLSSTATTASVSNIAVYDSKGELHTWTATFTKKEGSANDWQVSVSESGGRTLGSGELRFIGNLIDPATSTFVITDDNSGADPLSVTMDFSNRVTAYSGGTTSTLRVSSSDGNATGSLMSTIIEDGRVKLIYSNEKTEWLGDVAIADFRDPQRLEQVGQGHYQSVAGPERVLTSGKSGIGTIQSKRLEGSNVDLSAQFGDLILIQRGYQASSQIVSVSNEMIQQLFGIKGQG